ncbi:MAG TPA: MarR family transcriptional regulator [Burkholderiaceae bacterium]|nr:MarR family transcriptional regulator [Burkholderiaceae bacterium]
MPSPDRPAPRAKRAVAPPAPPAAPELADEPGHLLRRAHQAAVAAFHEVHGRGVTPVQYAVLRALADQPGIDQVTLAEAVALDTSTTADIAARLEAKGWIHRELLPRRQRALSLTPDGEAVLRAMLPHVRPMYEALLAPLTEAQRERFMHLLRKLVRP